MKKSIISIAAATGLMLTLTGCNDSPPAEQQPVQCVEADGEPCDDDPLDLDDLFEKHKTKAPTVTKSGGSGTRPKIFDPRRR